MNRQPKTQIDIARDFSEFPAGRFRSDGKFSGEIFREKHLVPALSKYQIVEIEFDGTIGYGSSFLEEAFGGLVRKNELSIDEWEKRLVLVTEDLSIKQSVEKYIINAGSA